MINKNFKKSLTLLIHLGVIETIVATKLLPKEIMKYYNDSFQKIISLKADLHGIDRSVHKTDNEVIEIQVAAKQFLSLVELQRQKSCKRLDVLVVLERLEKELSQMTAFHFLAH